MKRSLFIPLLCATALLAACDTATSENPQASRPPPEVSVVEVEPGSMPLTRDLVGRLASTRVAEVRARVAGIILARVYREGTDVDEGAVLYRIDPAPLQATLHAREAALAKARADATNAASTARRFRELAAKDLISTQDLDNALAAERSTAAAVKQALADVESAQLDLGYATVTAPIAGRAGRSLVTEGALVGEGEATRLTNIEQIDPLYVNFSLSVSELRELQGGVSAPDAAAQVEVSLPDGTPYPHAGTLDFSDLAVDPGTGAMSLRAVLPNPKRRLLPGMFVNLRLTTGTLENAIVLPQAAVLRDDTGAYVLSVDAEGQVAQRRVETHGMTQTGWIVTGDLDAGDRVIVEGVQKVQPGGKATVATPGDQTAQEQQPAPAGGN